MNDVVIQQMINAPPAAAHVTPVSEGSKVTDAQGSQQGDVPFEAVLTEAQKNETASSDDMLEQAAMAASQFIDQNLIAAIVTQLNQVTNLGTTTDSTVITTANGVEKAVTQPAAIPVAIPADVIPVEAFPQQAAVDVEGVTTGQVQQNGEAQSATVQSTPVIEVAVQQITLITEQSQITAQETTATNTQAAQNVQETVDTTALPLQAETAMTAEETASNTVVAEQVSDDTPQAAVLPQNNNTAVLDETPETSAAPSLDDETQPAATAIAASTDQETTQAGTNPEVRAKTAAEIAARTVKSATDTVKAPTSRSEAVDTNPATQVEEPPPDTPKTGNTGRASPETAYSTLVTEAKGSSPTSTTSTIGSARSAETRETGWVNQISANIETSAKNGQTTLRLQLYPEDLGRIDMRVTSSSEGVRVAINTDLPATGNLIESKLDTLRQTLTDAGIQVLNLSVGQGLIQDQNKQNLEWQKPHYSNPGIYNSGAASSDESESEMGTLDKISTSLEYRV